MPGSRLLKEYEQIDPNQRSELGALHPRTLELLAGAMDIKLPPFPQWIPIRSQPAPVAETATGPTEGVAV